MAKILGLTIEAVMSYANNPDLSVLQSDYSVGGGNLEDRFHLSAIPIAHGRTPLVVLDDAVVSEFWQMRVDECGSCLLL